MSSVTFYIFDITIRFLYIMTTMAAILKDFNCYLLPNHTFGWSGNVVEGIGAAWRFRIDKMVPFWYPRWPPWQPSWKSSNHICSWTISLTELKLEGDIGHWGNSELLKSFCCNIQNGGHGGHLQTVSQIEPKFDGRHRGDSELLNHLVPVSKMAAMVAILKFFKH